MGLLNSKDTAKYLGVSTRTLFRWRSEGKIKYYQVGNIVRFKKCEIDNFLESHVMETIDR